MQVPSENGPRFEATHSGLCIIHNTLSVLYLDVGGRHALHINFGCCWGLVGPLYARISSGSLIFMQKQVFVSEMGPSRNPFLDYSHSELATFIPRGTLIKEEKKEAL